MARLRYLERDELPADQQDLLSRNINLHRMLVHTTGGARAFDGIGKFIRFGSKLDARLRELAILQVGWLARSPYEWSHHIKIGLDFGVTDADIGALIDDSEGRPAALDAAALAVLQAAREITTDGTASDAAFAALQAHLDDECLVELVMTIAFYNGVVRLLATLQIDVEPTYQPYLDRFPLPANAG
jgi:alkylhydroperoxidase family enzyme